MTIFIACLLRQRIARMSTGGRAPKKPRSTAPPKLRSTTSADKRSSNRGQKAKKAAKNGDAVSERELKKLREAATVAARHTLAACDSRALERANDKKTGGTSREQDSDLILKIIDGTGEVTDATVQSLLRLVQYFETSGAERKCLQFLMVDSEKDVREKFRLADRFQLESLIVIFYLTAIEFYGTNNLSTNEAVSLTGSVE
ncbi:hypothetical protein CAEBREN_11418 [Caenorhabditis brenneri]|uniref:Uncharacterized protein n=1 Tax=Caenorhabditis brenneri TaxID=135651 RepID=G0NDY3_CAEBE|nr:hypothetical protein CAEBREN_11418 [Caenorhabditis brenneri]